MAKEEIVEGLRVALSKGESLEKAMFSFYNSGYTKDDIEEAARVLQAPQVPETPAIPQPTTKPLPQAVQPVPIQTQFQKSPPQPVPQQQYPIQPLVQSPSRVVQRVSGYGMREDAMITIVLFILLFVLFGILIAVIIFKNELSTFFNNLFWRALF